MLNLLSRNCHIWLKDCQYSLAALLLVDEKTSLEISRMLTVGEGTRMRIEDALRKVQLLLRVSRENGASEGEARNAARLAKALMERYSLAGNDVEATPAPVFRMTWVYWRHLMDEYGIILHHFGKRGSASLGDDRVVFIRLDSGQWQVQRTAPGGWETIRRDFGVESLRAYLAKSGPRIYSFARRW